MNRIEFSILFLCHETRPRRIQYKQPKAFKRNFSTIIRSLIITALKVFTIVEFLVSGIELICVVTEVDSMWISCIFYIVDRVDVDFDSVVR